MRVLELFYHSIQNQIRRNISLLTEAAGKLDGCCAASCISMEMNAAPGEQDTWASLRNQTLYASLFTVTARSCISHDGNVKIKCKSAFNSSSRVYTFLQYSYTWHHHRYLTFRIQTPLASFPAAPAGPTSD